MLRDIYWIIKKIPQLFRKNGRNLATRLVALIAVRDFEHVTQVHAKASTW